MSNTPGGATAAPEPTSQVGTIAAVVIVVAAMVAIGYFAFGRTSEPADASVRVVATPAPAPVPAPTAVAGSAPAAAPNRAGSPR
jgi:hypothetical protein